MKDAGFVYAKFFSNDCKPDGYTVEMPAQDTSCRSCGIGSEAARRRLDAGHNYCELRKNGQPLARFWIGRSGICRHGKAEYPLPLNTPYIYGLSYCETDDGPLAHACPLTLLLLALQEREEWQVGGRIVLCSPAALSKDELAETGLCAIAFYESLIPSLVFRPKTRVSGFIEKMAFQLRTRMPQLAVLAARAVSASPLRRYLIEGTLAGAPLRMSFNGSMNLGNYYSGVIFGAAHSTIRPLPLSMILDRSSIDIEASWFARRAAESPGGTVLPAFSRSILPVGPSFEGFLASLPKSAKSDIKKIRAGKFDSFVSGEFLDFLLFYHSMYLPMLASRHGGHSLHMDFSELSDLFNSGFIIFLKREKSPVAGVISTEARGVLLTKILGILGGSFSLTLQGANAALVYHMIKYSYDHGLKLVDFGYSSPFGSDGVLKFKLKWGAKVVADRNADLLRLHFRDEATRQRFFSACMPIILDSLEAYDPIPVSSSSSQRQVPQ